MAILLSPVLNEPQIDANGDPLAGGFIYTYLAGTTTPVTTYKTSTGTAHSNPIVLDAAGYYPSGTQLWLDSGKTYKFVVQDSLGATVRTIDNIAPVNDNISSVLDEWVVYNTTAITYISPTSFSVAGDQTSIFQVGRRVKSTVTGGTVYSTITVSSYVIPNTTITVVNDTGMALDSGLNSVSYGLLAPQNPSIQRIQANTTTAALTLENSGTGPALLANDPIWNDAQFLANGTFPAYRFVKRTVLTSTGPWTPQAGTRYYNVRIIGAGGAGGGAAATAAAGDSTAGAGGGAGGESWFETTTIPVSATFTAGAGGAGVAGGAGNAGGTTTFVGTGVNLSVPGGAGGATATTSTSTLTTAAACVAGGAPTGGSINKRGSQGEGGWRAGTGGATPHAYAGSGASSPFGCGGDPANGSIVSLNGAAATGIGSGGGGALISQVAAGAQAARPGGAGSGPICIIEEFA